MTNLSIQDITEEYILEFLDEALGMPPWTLDLQSKFYLVKYLVSMTKREMYLMSTMVMIMTTIMNAVTRMIFSRYMLKN
jgi:hypothetical protein